MGWRGSLMIAGAASAVLLGAAAARAQAEALPPGDEEAGAELYAAQCKGCHTVSIAPSLRGVADRPIASEADFHGYSDALKAKSGETWTVENLDAFLKSPPTFAPGTRMVMAVPDAQARADIIAYIRSLPPKR